MTGGDLVGSIIGGLILPFVISFLKSSKWSRQVKLSLAAALSLILAVIVNAATSGLDASFLANWGIIFTTASTLYATILDKSGIENTLRNIGVK